MHPLKTINFSAEVSFESLSDGDIFVFHGMKLKKELICCDTNIDPYADAVFLEGPLKGKMLWLTSTKDWKVFI